MQGTLSLTWMDGSESVPTAVTWYPTGKSRHGPRRPTLSGAGKVVGGGAGLDRPMTWAAAVARQAPACSPPSACTVPRGTSGGY